MSIASRAAKTITWTFDTTVDPEHDIIRERVLLNGAGGVWNGSSVTVDKAMGSVPVMAAIRVVSETIASLPLQVFERLPKGKQLAPDHRLYGMLHDSPNPEMTSMVFREVMQSHIESWGNAYAEIEYDTDGFPLHLWPLRPDHMTVLREKGELIYLYNTVDGEQRLTRRQVFHIPGIGFDGRVGYSPIHMARRGIALGIAVEEFAGRFYDHDARPGVAIMLGPEFDYDDDAKKRLAESFDATHAGLSNKHRTAVLDEGMGLEQIGWPPELGKLLGESQKWSIPTVSRIFNLSPHMLHDLERATFSNIEEQGINVTTYQFRPRTVRWDQQIKLQLMREDGRHFAEHNLDGLLKGKLSDRMAAYWQMYQMSAINPDEIRAKENLNPLPEGLGERYYYPQNLGVVAAEDADLKQQADVAGILIRAGFDPESVAQVIGLGVSHTGDLPITTRPDQLPPLQAVRSVKSVADRKEVAARYRPLFETATRNLIELERRMVLKEAERRFGEQVAEGVKSMRQVVAEMMPAEPPQLTISEGAFKIDVHPGEAPHVTVNVPKQSAPVVNMNLPEPRPIHRRIERDKDSNITAIVEEPA